MHSLTDALLKILGIDAQQARVWEVRVTRCEEHSDCLGVITVSGSREQALKRARTIYKEHSADLFIRPYRKIETDENHS